MPQAAEETAVPRMLAGECGGRPDLALAMAVQRRMRPRNGSPLATACYAGVSIAAEGLGGDYYDFLDLGPGAFGFVAGDVAGKGVAAALPAASLQASIRSECRRAAANLPAMLAHVNAYFFEATLPEQYATLFLGRYEEADQRLAFVNCGQQPALVVRRDGSVERLRTTAMPLGMVRNWSGEEEAVDLGPGDTVWVCSDGIVEAGLFDGEEFGEERLIALLRSSQQRPVEVAAAEIAEAARRWGPNGPADDITAVALRRR